MAKSMDEIVALCRRRGLIFQSSEIYGGINGFWDYGPLGARLKRNLKQAWWNDLVEHPPDGPDGRPLSIVPVESTIIMNPRVWEASGHVAGFNDPMVDCRETKKRYRADHLLVLFARSAGAGAAFFEGDEESRGRARKALKKRLGGEPEASDLDELPLPDLDAERRARVLGPDASEPGTLTEPRAFNLMFETYVGAVRDEDAKAYLRPETAQGIFVNFRNVLDSTRVKVPFGIAQIGKAFRNEVTPRNFTFRSREFEQMEVEFFIVPPERAAGDELDAAGWYRYWRENRYAWWQAMGLAGDNLRLRAHDSDELAHYAREGAGTSDVEYRFPFTDPDFGELEGIAHRTNYDLRQHAETSGMGDKFAYFDAERNERYFPHVIEPSAGADRGTLALICEAFTPDESRSSGVYMDFAPRVAPIKAAVYPLVNKQGMPEKAQALYDRLRRRFAVELDVKQSIGKRYARMDEAGTPYCFTVDGQSLEDDTVTVRERNTQDQQRISIDRVEAFLAERIQ